METLTLEKFNEIPNGELFATGVLPNSSEGIFMTNDGGELRWVAVKGYANDWTIYCHWSYNNEKWIEKHGDKVCNERNIKKCITCNDDVFKRYRF